MITGDQVLIAKEMSRILGLGLNIPDASGLPKLDEDGKVRRAPGRAGRRLHPGLVVAALLAGPPGLRHTKPPHHNPPPTHPPTHPRRSPRTCTSMRR